MDGIWKMILENLHVIIGVAITLIIVSFFWIRHKNIVVKGTTIGGIRFDIEDKKVDQIQIINAPIAACKYDILTPHLEVKAIDENGKGIEGKRVRLEFYNSLGIMSIGNISGDLCKKTDKAGCVVFDNISLKASGRIDIYIISDDIEQLVESIDIFPPGIPIDYWNEPIGSEKYKEKLERILNFTDKESLS